MKKVFLSGCFDIIHGGHLDFFEVAKKYGDYLIVSFASDKSLKLHKQRASSLPESHKYRILSALKMIDKVVIGDYLKEEGLDFKRHFLRLKPDVLMVTSRDKYIPKKKALCAQTGAKLVILPKSFKFRNISTTKIIRNIIKNNK